MTDETDLTREAVPEHPAIAELRHLAEVFEWRAALNRGHRQAAFLDAAGEIRQRIAQLRGDA